MSVGSASPASYLVMKLSLCSSQPGVEFSNLLGLSDHSGPALNFWSLCCSTWPQASLTFFSWFIQDYSPGVKVKGQPCLSSVQFSSVAQSCPTLCEPMDCSMPGLPVHHQLPEVTQTHVHCDSDAIQPSHPLSSPSPTAFNLSQHQGLFKWEFFTSGGQSIGVSASASVLPMNIQDWFPLGLTGWISL